MLHLCRPADSNLWKVGTAIATVAAILAYIYSSGDGFPVLKVIRVVSVCSQSVPPGVKCDQIPVFLLFPVVLLFPLQHCPISADCPAQEYVKNSAVAKSGALAAFALIFVSEIGDKTFFIAALLAMKVRGSPNTAG